MYDDFHRLALDALARRLTASNVAFEQDEGELTIDGRRLELAITFDRFVPQGGQTIAPVEFQLRLDGREDDRFRLGVLGVGSGREAAIESAVDEWDLLCATPVLAALGAGSVLRKPDRRPTLLAGWRFFPGRIGMRGATPAGLEAGGVLTMGVMAALGKAIAKWPLRGRDDMHSAFQMASFGPDGFELQAALDGLVDSELTAAISALPWPQKEPYLVKQMFVFREVAASNV